MTEKLGIVLGVFTAPAGHKGFPRPASEKLTLQAGHGIIGDKFAGHDLNKTVLIVGQNSYDLAKEQGIALEPGSFGENILLDFDPHQFDIGTTFQIGESILEITERCTICSHLGVFGQKLPSIVKDCRGLYCKIIHDGVCAPYTDVWQIHSDEDVLLRDSESTKLYQCIQQFPNHFIRTKTILLMKEYDSEESLDAQIQTLEQAPNLLDALSDFAEYPDFLLTGYLRTAQGKITHMGGVAGEIELTFPASNGSFLQLITERIKRTFEGSLYLCCAIDMIESGPEESPLQRSMQANSDSSEIPENVMMDENEWAIYLQSLEDGDYTPSMWNMGIFVIYKEKQLAQILGYYP